MTPAEEDALIATARKQAANEGTGIVTRDQVIRLAIRAAVAAERARAANKAAPETVVYSDSEWRIRCEIAAAIREGEK